MRPECHVRHRMAIFPSSKGGWCLPGAKTKSFVGGASRPCGAMGTALPCPYEDNALRDQTRFQRLLA